MLNYQLVTPPTVEPVTLELAKAHLRVDITDDDTLITAYISAARQYAERLTNRAFFNQTWRLSLDHFPVYRCGGTLPTRGRDDFYSGAYYNELAIRLPIPRCQSVASITYLDVAGVQQTLSPSAYYVDTTSQPARIVPLPGAFWPYTQDYLPGSVQVTYVAGSYGDGATVNTCPQSVVLAILMLVGHFYDNRNATSEVILREPPFAVQALLNSEKFVSFSFGNN
ncbi:head-tail connector protein [Acidipila sp. EB88]|uniref:head-tail connector protein n=1 Tax=Acidipila sp. EB88 TaxID=2305226 RepID=UPI000F5FD489|nr:head-tail connector protein [Acidipila sp. EB88]RRA48994.1 DNA-packaging protein [Acidipila sp. EB88]